MNRLIVILILILGAAGLGVMMLSNQGENNEPILAVVDYTVSPTNTSDVDGVALVDLNPNSETFGEIVQRVDIGAGVVPHHPYYNRDKTKLYTTALLGDELYAIDVHDDRIDSIRALDTGGCIVGEDLYFSKDETKFYLTCMGSSTVLVFDAKTDQLIEEISAPAPADAFIKYPHGIAVDEKLDRMIVTETVSPALDDPGASVTVIEFSTGKVLSTIPVAKNGDNRGAPVEVVFHPNGKVAYLTGMLEASLWVLVWNEQTGTFDAVLVDDGEGRGESWPLEPLFGPDGNLYVSWALPGHVNVYNVNNPEQPKLIRTIKTDKGAHHVDFSKDGKYMFVQNNMLNLEGMDAGTISVVELKSGNVVGTVNSFLDANLRAESMILLGGGAHSH
jgi:DNA-binding beta-propeller fold protein YncE